MEPQAPLYFRCLFGKLYHGCDTQGCATGRALSRLVDKAAGAADARCSDRHQVLRDARGAFSIGRRRPGWISGRSIRTSAAHSAARIATPDAAHGYAFERAAAANPDHQGVASDVAALPPWLAFERRILVKENFADVLRKTLRTGSDRHLALLQGESITIGTATDPYRPAERRFRLTRQILGVIAEHPGLVCRIITKSPLVTRDIDLLQRINRHSHINIHVSLITVDRDLARRIEPRAPTPEARLRAIKRLRDAGIDVGVNVMPILPGITDSPAQLDELVGRIAATGATHIGACALRLRAAARKRYMPWIAQEFPQLAARYQATYAQGFRTGDSYRDGLTRVMSRLCCSTAFITAPTMTAPSPTCLRKRRQTPPPISSSCRWVGRTESRAVAARRTHCARHASIRAARE